MVKSPLDRQSEISGADTVLGVELMDPCLKHCTVLVNTDFQVESLGRDVKIVSVRVGRVNHELQTHLPGRGLQPL